MANGEGFPTQYDQIGYVHPPQMNERVAEDLVTILYGMEVTSITPLVSYSDKNYYVTVKDVNNNPNVETLWPHGYTLKITNSIDSQTNHTAAEHLFQGLLADHGIPCPRPVLNTHGDDQSTETIYTPTSQQEGWVSNAEDNRDRLYGRHVVRLLTYIPGKTLNSVIHTAHLFHSAGKMMGKVHKILKESNFEHPAYEDYQTMWNMTSVPKLADLLHVLPTPDDNKLIQDIIEQFQKQVVNNYEKMRKGIIHGDFNDHNLLVKSTGQSSESTDLQSHELYEVFGVLDFGDSCSSYYVFDVAIGICYLMLESNIVDPLHVGGHFLAGYESEFEINKTEFEVLRICVAARFAQSLVLGLSYSKRDPGNTYLLTGQKNGWIVLKNLWNCPSTSLYATWQDITKSYQN